MDDFIQFVEHQAMVLGKRFFPNKFEGRTFFDLNTGWELEDISGWLFDNSEVDLVKRFIIIQGSKEESSFSTFYYKAVWSLNEGNQIIIEFIKYSNN
ncbi:hypothetical protein [Paenibacillus sp. ATY16]|uniref:hypothetical protein n=1 Tax=Paenibacillus sp. ATY16 TaxID=1759312 RepID=UPI00200EDCCC|nr:hypothetical protein [Paenibacillus sp. ATY16]MCK9860006.1 hypothetical protein [Paenibacillus sp. ATY16]